MVLFLGDDLVFVSQVKAAAGSDRFRHATSTEAAFGILNDQNINLCIFDLRTRNVDVGEIAGFCSANNVELVGFAPHVRTDLLGAARDAGFNKVLPRGQFARNLAAIISNATQNSPD